MSFPSKTANHKPDPPLPCLCHFAIWGYPKRSKLSPQKWGFAWLVPYHTHILLVESPQYPSIRGEITIHGSTAPINRTESQMRWREDESSAEKWPWRVAMRDEMDLDLMLVLRRKLFKVWRRNPSDLHKSQFSPKVQRRKFNMELNKGYYHLLDLILFPAGLKIASISPLSVAVFAHAFPLPGKRQLARQNCRARLWHVGFNQPKLVGLRLKLRKKASRSYIYTHLYLHIYICIYICLYIPKSFT